MLAGVRIVDPSTTWIEAETVLEPDAVIAFNLSRSQAPAPCTP